MNLRDIKLKFGFLIKTPLHPLWLLARRSHEFNTSIAEELNDDVLDIGCGHQQIKYYVDENIDYYSLDYYHTAQFWYGSTPEIYGDAQSLPIAGESFNNVLLLDVLEHLVEPHKCIGEINRILKPGGKLILQVPFMYPLHDVPLDFHRWTEFGLKKILNDYGLTVAHAHAVGKPVETSGVLLNIGLCKTLINAINDNSIYIFFLFFLPVFVPIINIICFLLSCTSKEDGFMPLNYRVIAIKQA